MRTQMTADLILKLTYEKAKSEGKHPMEIIEEAKKLIEDKRRMEREMIDQAVSWTVSAN